MKLNLLNFLNIDPWLIAGIILVGLVIWAIISKLGRFVFCALLIGFILITGALSAYFNIKYFTARGAIYGKDVEGSHNVTKVIFDEKNTFNFDLLGFRSTGVENEYSVIVKFDKTLTIKDNGFYLNNHLATTQERDLNHLKSKFEYSFFDYENKELCTDTLYINLFTYEKTMDLNITTKGGNKAVDFWKVYLGKNDFILSLKQDQTIHNTDIVKDKEIENSATTNSLKITYISSIQDAWQLPIILRIDTSPQQVISNGKVCYDSNYYEEYLDIEPGAVYALALNKSSEITYQLIGGVTARLDVFEEGQSLVVIFDKNSTEIQVANIIIYIN